MTIYILWVRHCESCSNVISHSKSIIKKLTHPIQGFIIPPNCTLMGIIQSFMFGYKLLPLIVKLYPKFKKIDFYCSLLKRAMITSKLITYGFSKSNVKIKQSKFIERLCNVSEKPNILEKVTGLNLTNNVNYDISDKHIKQINKRYKKTGKRISKRIKKKSKNCKQSDYKSFKKYTLRSLKKNNTLNVIVSHGKYLRENFNVSELNNLDALLVEYDLKNNKHKIINKFMNTTDISKDYLSHETIKNDTYDFNYRFNNNNLKTSISFDNVKNHFKQLDEYLNLDKKINEFSCE